MNGQGDGIPGRTDAERQKRIEREITAEVALDILKRCLGATYRFMPSKVELRARMLWIDGQTVAFRDALTHARMWVNLKNKTGGLDRDARWTATVIEEYRRDGQETDDWMVQERATAHKISGVRWVRDHIEEMVDVYRQTHSRHLPGPMVHKLAPMVAAMAKEDRMAIEAALGLVEAEDEVVIDALQSAAIDAAVIAQHEAFRSHPAYERGIGLLRRWKQAGLAAERAAAMVDAQEQCDRIDADAAWATGSSSFDAMLLDLWSERQELLEEAA